MHTMKITRILLLLVAVTALDAQLPATGQTVTAHVDASVVRAPISPYIYGQFIEQLGNLVYNGLWSEMLDDRKFYYAVQPPPPVNPAASRFGGFGGMRGVVPGRWNPIGPRDSVVMDTKHPFVGVHTPLITLDANAPRGIAQSGVRFIRGKSYTGRIQLAGDATAKVAINIVWGTGPNSTRQVVRLGKLGLHYRKFLFSFKADQTGAARFEIVGQGSGSFHIGAISLMPSDNVDGFRPDAIAALKSLHSGIYRFPGGNFVSAYDWRNTVGDPDKRPPTFDPVWNAVQSNDIGLDEFMTFCKLIDVKPYITVNAGLGDAWSAAQEVEYTNGSVKTPMGRWRAQNGHPKPYDVRFWGIGNEMWGISYQFGAMKPYQYMYKQNQFAKAMRKVDPGIVLIASGAMPDTMTGSRESLSLGPDLVPKYLSPEDWDGMLLSRCFNYFDMISEHYYNYGNTHLDLATGRQVPNNPNEPITDWMRRPANHVRIKYEEYKHYEKLFPQLVKHPKPLSIDEWAYSGNNRYPVYPAYAWVFQEMFRHSNIIKMAAYTFATSLLKRTASGDNLNSNGLVFKIYRDHFGTIPVEVSGNSPQPKPTDPPGGEQPVVNAGSPTFPLDVAGAWTTHHHSLTVAVLNPTNVEQSINLAVSGAKLAHKGILWRLASANANGKDAKITSQSVSSLSGLLTLPRYSVNIYVFQAR